MKKEKIKHFFQKEYVQLGLIGIILMLLIFLSVLFVGLIENNNRVLTDVIFILLITIGALSGYQLTKENIKKTLYLGITRKQLLREFVQRAIMIAFVIVVLNFYYALMYQWIYQESTSFWKLIEYRKLILMLSFFVAFSFSGMIFGMIPLKKYARYLLLILVIAISVFMLFIRIGILMIIISVIGAFFVSYFGYQIVLRSKI